MIRFSGMAGKRFPTHDPTAQLVSAWLSILVGVCPWCTSLPGTDVAWAQEQQEQQSPMSYDSKGKRDPFVPLVREGRWIGGGTAFSGSHPSGLMLVGILWDPAGQSLALINDTEMRVGETISGYEVTEIRPDAVVLVRDGKPVMLQISFESSATPPSDSVQ